MSMFQISRMIECRVSFVAFQVLPQNVVSDLHFEEVLLETVEVGRPSLLQELEPGFVGVHFLWKVNYLFEICDSMNSE